MSIFKQYEKLNENYKTLLNKYVNDETYLMRICRTVNELQITFRKEDELIVFKSNNKITHKTNLNYETFEPFIKEYKTSMNGKELPNYIKKYTTTSNDFKNAHLHSIFQGIQSYNGFTEFENNTYNCKMFSHKIIINYTDGTEYTIILF